ncbi:hypothetical protein EDC14_101160 [Hydrogenispora ethanolica]|uniref:Pyridoxal phosphate homeostasis protein n=1 Tax=Hydrogenispora ethanolica TaxID=1082276 RepID=A0A4R1RTR7_HYDET|nr:YggS family pyridoxal phosphate-dependent enzyme [Hydrogenispora ethanolica]TCL69938.1 hypothetical protein EDC14_101160 [Hydrogenispora ethanolica]
MSIADNWLAVKQRVAESAARAGRDPSTVTIIAVTKYVTAEQMNEALRAGVTDVGENRVQDALGKFPALEGKVVKHLIGSLQTNKVKPVITEFDLIHSVDRSELVAELQKQAAKLQRKVSFLIQLNISGEITKHGLPPQGLPELLQRIQDCPNLIPCGLMTMAPFSDNPETARPVFRELTDIYKEAAVRYHLGETWRYLSMGMSQDFEVAVEEGANFIRVGTAIFK